MLNPTPDSTSFCSPKAAPYILFKILKHNFVPGPADPTGKARQGFSYEYKSNRAVAVDEPVCTYYLCHPPATFPTVYLL